MSSRPLRSMLAMLAAVSLVSACGDEDEDDDFDQFRVTMNQANEIPTPSATGATGSATFTDRGTTFDFTIDVTGMTGVTGAHIHPGPAGQTGGVLVPLFPPAGVTTPTGAISGRLVTGSFDATAIRVLQGATVAMSMDSLRTRMRNGTLYVNVHTTANPAGEIRGQIVPRN